MSFFENFWSLIESQIRSAFYNIPADNALGVVYALMNIFLLLASAFSS